MGHYLERNFKLILEYDGSGYHGWQRQKGVLTVQEVLESSLAIMLGRELHVRAAGRTDAGVHALGQVVNFYARTRLQPMDIQRGLNSLLPDDIVVKHAEEVDQSFHARYSAKAKLYRYLVLNRPLPSALWRRYAWHVPYRLNIEDLNRALEYFRGEHDFSAFRASRSSVKSSVRVLYQADCRVESDGLLVFSFLGNGFLRHMVRIIVGTVIEVGMGKRTPDDIPAVMASKDRNLAGITAPAHGLYLVRVEYDDEGEIGEGRKHNETCKANFRSPPFGYA
ncbi:MAG: tRNA pseudouridine(38-40) synthase TruA [Syntrophobacterales bacterium]|nr:tRNA pseudouridine(38-40) synthase TruA [Syntrophobacterales bacterium]